MELKGYHIDIEPALDRIKKKHARTILIQLPEGLKPYLDEIHDHVMDRIPDIQVLISADPCYGACDMPCASRLDHLNVDTVIHIGHTPIPSMKITKGMDIIFLNAYSLKSLSSIVTKALDALIGKKIGIVTTAQHLHEIPQVKEILEQHGFTVFIGKGDRRVSSPGQILGCNFSSALEIQSQVDSYLYIGSGFFHPLGLSLSTKKPVLIADPYTDKVIQKELEDIKDRVLRQRYGAITQAKMAKIFGILVGMKPGQQRIDLAFSIQKDIQDKGKKAYVLTVDHISPMILENFPFIDCYVSTLCPRVAIDDHLQYKQNIITPIELDIALGKRSWDTYQFDEIQ